MQVSLGVPIKRIRGVCAGCLAPAKRICSRCHLTYYCTVDCQRKSWPTHKPCCGTNVFDEVTSNMIARACERLPRHDVSSDYSRAMLGGGVIERVLLLADRGDMIYAKGLKVPRATQSRRDQIREERLEGVRRLARHALHEVVDGNILLIWQGPELRMLAFEYSLTEKRVVAMLH